MKRRGAWGVGSGVWAVALATVVLGCSRQNGERAERDSAAHLESSPGAQSVGRPERQLPTPHSSLRTILFIGTSLTAGLGLPPDSAYPQLVGEKIAAAGLPYGVVNAGVSGETTAGLLERIDWVLRTPASVIVIESGANDGLRGIPVATVKRNLEEIVARVKRARPAATVLLVQMEAPPNMGAEYTRAFHAMFGEVARDQGVELMPFLLDGVAGKDALNQADGIHPNQRGEQIVADNVWRSLAPLLRRASGGAASAAGAASAGAAR